MTIESDSFLRLLAEISDDLGEVRCGARRADKRVTALVALLQAVERGRAAERGRMLLAPETPPTPPAAWIRRFLEVLPDAWREREDTMVLGVIAWLTMLATPAD